jgi:hypothetical protein
MAVVLPEPLHVSYAARARPTSSAEITVQPIERGGLMQRIAHAPLAGITREMLFWWMHHIGDTVEFEGHRVKAYRLWHPRDHVDWSCDGQVRAGAKFRIVEAFGRNPKFLVDSIFDVPKLDMTGFRIESTMFGIGRITVDEDWTEGPEGVCWTNTMRFLPVTTWAIPLVRLGRVVARPQLTAWLQHNVEEVGYIPEFLPKLYDRVHRRHED